MQMKCKKIIGMLGVVAMLFISASYAKAETYQYDELTAETFLANKNKGETDIEDPTRYNNIFEGGAYMSNMFTAMKENETLEAVSFYTADQNLDYTVEVYTGVDGSPTNGTLKASVSGEDLIMGYHTVYLPTPIALRPECSDKVRQIHKNKEGISCPEPFLL